MSLPRWTAVWRSGWPELAPLSGADLFRPLEEISLCLELTAPPLRRASPLRLWRGSGPEAQAVALYLLANGALRLVHGEVDLATPEDFVRPGETIDIRYRACARGRRDILDCSNPDRRTRVRMRAAVDQTICVAQAMPGDDRYLSVCHIAAVAPFGVPPTDLPGLASGTPVLTPGGSVLVEDLRDGMEVLTASGDAAPVRWVETRPRLSLGRQAPVLLRAPYFGLDRDICVTPDTRILRFGPSVEYICGTEAVLVRAADMVGGPAARRNPRQPVRNFHHLMLDDHDCVLVDRCPLETALLSDVIAADDVARHPALSEWDKTPFLPVLDRAGAQALAAASNKGRGARG